MDADNEKLGATYKQVLVDNQELNNIRASIRLKIIQILLEQEPLGVTVNDAGCRQRPNHLLNKLILEYLTMCDYQSARDIFIYESGVTELGRVDLEALMKNVEFSDAAPLLQQIVEKRVFKP